jgi:hypothetical protein
VVPFVGGTGFKDVDFPGGIEGSSIRAHFQHLELYRKTIDASAYWPFVKCPVLFISSSNDFHSAFERIYRSMALLPHPNWRVSVNMHQNHGPGPEQWVLLNRWFDHYLGGAPEDIPITPPSRCTVKGGRAFFTVTPADQDSLLHTEIYYSYDPNARTRFWNRAEAQREGASWSADFVVHQELPFYVFALCRYGMPQKVSLQRGETGTFTLNSLEHVLVPASVRLEALHELPKSRTIFEDFQDGLQDWSSRDQRSIKTYKFQSPDLDRSNSRKLALTVDPGGKRLTLRLHAGSKFLSREANLGDFSCEQTVEGHGSRVIVIDRDAFEGAEGKRLEWSRIATFEVSLIDRDTQQKLELTAPGGSAILKRIQLID